VSDEEGNASDAVGRLAAGVEHELNNSLASIIAFSQLIRSDPNLPAELRSQADLLIDEAKRTRAIAANLLDIVRERRSGADERVGDDGGSPAGSTRQEPREPPRVLVLDDEPSIREFLGRVLSRAGYAPVLTATGAEALDIIRAAPPAAILCDHRMASMSGTAFHAAVAEIDPALARHFAFMSGDVLNPDLRAFAVAQGVHLVAKPFDIATVTATVRTLVETPPADGPRP
jgi:CheY-like chemotaxis protein